MASISRVSRSMLTRSVAVSASTRAMHSTRIISLCHSRTPASRRLPSSLRTPAPFLVATSYSLSPSRPISSWSLQQRRSFVLPTRVTQHCACVSWHRARCFATASESQKDSSSSSQQNSKQQQQQQDKQDEQSSSEDSENAQAMAAQAGGSIWRKIFIVLFSATTLTMSYYCYQHGVSLHEGEKKVEGEAEAILPLRVLSLIVEGFVDKGENMLGISARPLLPPPTLDPFGRRPRTLILAIEDVVTHLEWDRFSGYDLKPRPELDYFLESCVKLGYELVFFSRKPQFETEPQMAVIDRAGFVRHRLYHEQMNFAHGMLCKDLTRLNRELQRVLVIDSTDTQYDKHTDNVLLIPAWKNADPNDKELRKLLPILEKIQRFNVYDMRTIVKKRRELNGQNDDLLFAEDEELERQAAIALEQRKKRKRGRFGEEKSVATASPPSSEQQVSWFAWARNRLGL